MKVTLRKRRIIQVSNVRLEKKDIEKGLHRWIIRGMVFYFVLRLSEY